MSGVTFTVPDNPGTAVQWSGTRTVRPSVAIADKVAVPFTHDWGPLGAESGGINEFLDVGDFEALFGDSDTEGHDAVLGAFVGPGVENRPGAGSVIGYRMDDGTAARATHTFQATATDMLKLDALYAGTRGDRISSTIASDPVDPTNRDRLSILFDGVTVEKYSYDKANIDSLVAAINARSTLVRASRLAAAAALTHVSNIALTGGDDGAAIAMADVMDALAALEFQSFTVLGPQDVTDTATAAAIVAWAQTQAEQDRPVEVVLGGPEAEGLLHDDFLDKDVSTAVLAPRIAGALAGAGEERSLTLCPFAGLTPVGANDPDAAIARTTYDEPHVISLCAGASVDQLKPLADAGVTVFRQVESATADLAIAKCVTTFTNATDDSHPLELWSDPRIIRVLDLYIRELRKWGDENMIGGRVTAEQRAAVRVQGIGMNDDRVARGLFQPGTDATDSPFFETPTGVGPEDSIPFTFGAKIVRTNNFLIGRGTVI